MSMNAQVGEPEPIEDEALHDGFERASYPGNYRRHRITLYIDSRRAFMYIYGFL